MTWSWLRASTATNPSAPPRPIATVRAGSVGAAAGGVAAPKLGQANARTARAPGKEKRITRCSKFIFPPKVTAAAGKFRSDAQRKVEQLISRRFETFALRQRLGVKSFHHELGSIHWR